MGEKNALDQEGLAQAADAEGEKIAKSAISPVTGVLEEDGKHGPATDALEKNALIDNGRADIVADETGLQTPGQAFSESGMSWQSLIVLASWERSSRRACWARGDARKTAKQPRYLSKFL